MLDKKPVLAAELGNYPDGTIAVALRGVDTATGLPVDVTIAQNSNDDNVVMIGGFVTTEVHRDFYSIKKSPVNGLKTATVTLAEIFAGASRLDGRYYMGIYNEGVAPVFLGSVDCTVANGWKIAPGDSIYLKFDPIVDTPMYIISTESVPVRVMELGI